MKQEWLEPETVVPRTPMFWAVVGTLVVGQLVALVMLCSGQVEKAEARHAEFQMQQTALADCLQYIPGATIGSCTARIAGNGDDAASAVAASDTRVMGATPVNFVIR
ncbi:hypothetical protein [Ramlibacter sp.]|uniref:hypothetical protein n=1 Tax=Ramlibacter sp. TaxID=1917967 RepID=UPI003D14AE77